MGLLFALLLMSFFVPLFIAAAVNMYRHRSPYAEGRRPSQSYTVLLWVCNVGVFYPLLFPHKLWVIDLLPQAWLLLVALMMSIVSIDHWRHKAKTKRSYKLVVFFYYVWMWFIYAHQAFALLLFAFSGVGDGFRG